MRGLRALAGWVGRAAEALSGRPAPPASLEDARRMLRGLVEAQAVTEALCEAATARLDALEDEQGRWERRAGAVTQEGLHEAATEAAERLRSERDAVRGLFGVLVGDLERSSAMTRAATDRFEGLARLAQSSGFRRPGPTPRLDAALRRAARVYVAEHLDLDELVLTEEEGVGFRERVFARLEERGGLH